MCVCVCVYERVFRNRDKKKFLVKAGRANVARVSLDLEERKRYLDSKVKTRQST